MKNWYIRGWKERLPHCIKCPNRNGSCGAPCTCCEANEKWIKDWQLYLYIDETFVVFKRRVETIEKRVGEKHERLLR